MMLHAIRRPLLQRSTRIGQRSIYTIKDNLFTAHATAAGEGRNGKTVSNDSPPLEVTMSTPKEMGGPGQGHNPEQLFAMGYSACFLGALKAVAGQHKKSAAVKDAKIHANVMIGTSKEKPGFALQVKLEVENVSDHELIKEAHEFCPYSRALNEGIKIDVGPK